ncbi:MAG: JAB domain-containing protein [Myxococcota bacterium]
MWDEDLSLLVRALAVSPEDREALARRLFAVGGAVGLWRAGAESLVGLDPQTAARWSAIQALWQHVHRPTTAGASVIESSQSVVACLDPFLPLSPCESFHAIFLDGRGCLQGVEEIARGSVDACLIHPREVFAAAIRARATAVAVAHNHPSGNPEPSDADRSLTDRLATAGQLLGIPLIDHLIIGRGQHRSLGPGQPTSSVAMSA